MSKSLRPSTVSLAVRKHSNVPKIVIEPTHSSGKISGKRSASENLLLRKPSKTSNKSDRAGSTEHTKNASLTLTTVRTVGSGDNVENEEAVSRKFPKITSKKLYFMGTFLAYAIICTLFFLLVALTLVVLLFWKLHYFIREPITVPIFEVIPGVVWVVLKFLGGAFIHALLATLAILFLVGTKKTEKVVFRHGERLLMWMLIIACVAEYFMVSGTFNYLSSQPTVENGEVKDTYYPHIEDPKFQNCFDSGIIRDAKFEPNEPTNLIRANLKWLVSVSCARSKTNKNSVRNWEAVLNKVFTGTESTTSKCKELKKMLKKGANRDCNIFVALDSVIYTWLIVDVLGVCFCFGILYLYLKTVVKRTPGRFSFEEGQPLNPEDIEALREIAEKSNQLANRSSKDKSKEEIPKVTKKEENNSPKTKPLETPTASKKLSWPNVIRKPPWKP